MTSDLKNNLHALKISRIMKKIFYTLIFCFFTTSISYADNWAVCDEGYVSFKRVGFWSGGGYDFYKIFIEDINAETGKKKIRLVSTCVDNVWHGEACERYRPNSDLQPEYQWVSFDAIIRRTFEGILESIP